MFRIDTIKPYPEDYGEATEVARQELHSNSRPALLNHVVDMGAYQVVFLGYPNWWGTMPMAVRTFLEEYDFRAKRLFRFARMREADLEVV